MKLDRVLPTDGRAFQPIDWFDQRPGDVIRAVWVGSGKTEYWRVTGPTLWTTLKPGRAVECVHCEELTLEQVRALRWRQFTDRLNDAIAADRVIPFRVIPLS